MHATIKTGPHWEHKLKHTAKTEDKTKECSGAFEKALLQAQA